jgi:VWFA-related protein
LIRDTRPLRSGVDVTAVTATVRDEQGRLVIDLPREAFEVYEDGERQAITQFTQTRVPVGLGVLLDVSDSMYGKRMREARSAVERFLFELLDPSDEFFVLPFNHRSDLFTPWTSTPAVVRETLDRLRPFGGTSIYDAVLKALPLLESRTRQRAALLIISDGADTASDASLRQVRSALFRSDAFVYAIAIDSMPPRPINTRVNPEALGAITDQSGGRTEVVLDTAALMEATARIAEELNSQYVLGYSPSRPPDGDFHSIRVKVPRAGYRVRARNGYVAGPRRR